uniref:NIDO domain-containing protein n=1 Tax=Panagrolaimus sp. JU765 TaxID=591449 RepID=A0AC34RC09_9BILA
MWKVGSLLLLCLTFGSAKVEISDFFPFGLQNGDQILAAGDDASSNVQGTNGLSGIPAQVGFDSGDGQNRYMVDVSCTDYVITLANMTNVGSPGVLIFQIDSTNIKAAGDFLPSKTSSIPSERNWNQKQKLKNPGF